MQYYNTIVILGLIFINEFHRTFQGPNSLTKKTNIRIIGGVTCPDGIQPSFCLMDPCRKADCKAYPHAKCRRKTCGNCLPEFYDHNGDVVDCNEEQIEINMNCPIGIKEMKCDLNPCKLLSCKMNPKAHCVPYPCGGCYAVFYDDKGFEVDCDTGKSYDPYADDPTLTTTSVRPTSTVSKSTSATKLVDKKTAKIIDIKDSNLSLEIKNQGNKKLEDGNTETKTRKNWVEQQMIKFKKSQSTKSVVSSTPKTKTTTASKLSTIKTSLPDKKEIAKGSINLSKVIADRTTSTTTAQSTKKSQKATVKKEQDTKTTTRKSTPDMSKPTTIAINKKTVKSTAKINLITSPTTVKTSTLVSKDTFGRSPIKAIEPAENIIKFNKTLNFKNNQVDGKKREKNFKVVEPANVNRTSSDSSVTDDIPYLGPPPEQQLYNNPYYYNNLGYYYPNRGGRITIPPPFLPSYQGPVGGGSQQPFVPRPTQMPAEMEDLIPENQKPIYPPPSNADSLQPFPQPIGGPYFNPPPPPGFNQGGVPFNFEPYPRLPPLGIMRVPNRFNAGGGGRMNSLPPIGRSRTIYLRNNNGDTSSNSNGPHPNLPPMSPHQLGLIMNPPVPGSSPFNFPDFRQQVVSSQSINVLNDTVPPGFSPFLIPYPNNYNDTTGLDDDSGKLLINSSETDITEDTSIKPYSTEQPTEEISESQIDNAAIMEETNEVIDLNDQQNRFQDRHKNVKFLPLLQTTTQQLLKTSDKTKDDVDSQKTKKNINLTAAHHDKKGNVYLSFSPAPSKTDNLNPYEEFLGPIQGTGKIRQITQPRRRHFCPVGLIPHECDVSICKDVSCPDHEYFECHIYNCGGCYRIFKDLLGYQINCELPTPPPTTEVTQADYWNFTTTIMEESNQ